MKSKKKKVLVPRTHCSNTLTESGFFGLIRSALRRLSIRWKPRSDYLLSVRRPKKNGGRSKWEYQCELCLGWFIRAHVEADHRVSCGSLKSFNDIGPFVERLLCEIDGWRVVCKPCHHERTQGERYGTIKKITKTIKKRKK